MMTKVRFLHHPTSQPCRAVHQFMLEVGIPFQDEVVNLMDGENEAPAFKDTYNPTGQVPILVDGDNPVYHMMDALSRVASPYQLNPMNINPLRDLVEDSIDFAMVRACTAFKVFISATNVETGKVKVFPREELTVDMIMASACLPNLYQAVEIDGVPYWDGGYIGNPALFPFHGKTGSDDIIVVQINPIERKGAPRTPMEIQNRVNEISFNSSLLKELRAIDFVDRLICQGKLSPDDYRQVRVHVVENQAELIPLGASSKMNVEWEFLTKLRDLGRATMTRWLDENFKSVGESNTVDVRAMFQGIGAQHQG